MLNLQREFPMYKAVLISLLSLFICVNGLAQSSVTDFMLLRVNALRDSLRLSKVKPDLILDKAALNQATYIATKKKLGHEQTTPKMETLADRILHFGANRTYFGENVAFVQVSQGVSNKEIADQLFEAWKKSPGHYANMVNPNFSRLGFEIKRTPQGIYATQVFASEEITLPKQFNKIHPDWGVKPNAVVCKMLKDTYETMTFANNVQIVDYEVYFFFHDMPFFESVITDNKDGLAIDVILREQLPCSRENQFHGSPVFDGQMQKPVYKKDLFKNNISGNPHKMYVKIGEIPENMRQLDWAVNVIVIKNNFNCDYCLPGFINSRMYPLLPLEPQWEIFEKRNYFELHKAILVRDTFNFNFHFSRLNDQFESYDAMELQRMLSMLPYVKKINADVHASIEGLEQTNKDLLQKRKQTLSKFLIEKNAIQPQVITWNLSENWALLERQIQEYQLDELRGKSKLAVKDFFRENRSMFYDSLLYEQRASRVQAFVDTIIVIKELEKLIQFSKYDETFNWQDYEHSDLLEEAYKHSYNVIDRETVMAMLRNKKLQTNLLAAAVRNNSIFDALDSLSIEKYFNVANINSKNAQLVFNYAHFLTHYWYRNFRSSYSLRGIAKTISPEQLKAMIKGIEGEPSINKSELEKLKFNIYLSGVLYYTAFSDWKLKEQYFDAIVEHVKRQQFRVQEAESLALFFNYFHKFEKTVQLLEPYFDQNQLSENGIFWMAETATMIRQKIPNELYLRYMSAAKNKNHDRYCAWLNDYFQIQRDEQIKQDFCKSCKSSKVRRK